MNFWCWSNNLENYWFIFKVERKFPSKIELILKN